MNTILLNTVSLDGGTIIKKGSGGGGVTIKNQEKSLEITENGVTEVAPDSGFTGLSKVVVNTNVASSGGGATEPKPVNDVTFYDYDGVVLYSYTKDEFLAISEMPPLPTRKGLICQEWNWDYEDAIAYVSEYGFLNIGATYITDDGKTRLYIRIAAEGRMDVPLYIHQDMANGVSIDWGDGSAPQTLKNTGGQKTTHRYDKIGEYVITLDTADGCTLGFGGNSSYSQSIFGGGSTYDRVHQNMLQAVEIGNGVTSIRGSAFCQCYSLKSVVIPNSITSIENRAFEGCGFTSIVIPNSITSIGTNAFYECKSLSSVAIPNSVTSIEGNGFYACSALARVIIPMSVTSIGASAFYNCYSLASIVIPSSITNIENRTFQNCYGIKFFDFSRSVEVPNLTNINAITGLSYNYEIIVPDALYDEWIAATNWSDFKSYTIKKSDWDASQS